MTVIRRITPKNKLEKSPSEGQDQPAQQEKSQTKDEEKIVVARSGSGRSRSQEVKTVKIESTENKEGNFARRSGMRLKKACSFCTQKSEPRYWDSVVLRRFLSDRGRIFPRIKSGACAKHQRLVSREIKRARHLALLPFTLRVN